MGMQKIVAILCFVSFAALANAGESIKLLLSDVHAEALVSYLQSKDVTVSQADPFVEIRRSDELLIALASYANLMEEAIYDKRASIWDGRSPSADEAGVSRNFQDLLNAKIGHQLAVDAIKQLAPDFAAADQSWKSVPADGRKPDAALLAQLGRVAEPDL